MPLMQPSQRAALAAVAAVIAAGTGIAVFSAGDYSDATTAVIHDAGMSRASGHERMTDLLTREVEPGAQATTEVTLPRGGRVTDIAPAAGFSVVSEQHEDRDADTLYTLTVRNDSPAATRFVGFITFTSGED